MAKTTGSKKEQNRDFRIVRDNKASVCRGAHHPSFVHNSKANLGSMSVIPRRAAVDDATWERLVMEVMEEYDEAWTKLADA